MRNLFVQSALIAGAMTASANQTEDAPGDHSSAEAAVPMTIVSNYIRPLVLEQIDLKQIAIDCQLVPQITHAAAQSAFAANHLTGDVGILISKNTPYPEVFAVLSSPGQPDAGLNSAQLEALSESAFELSKENVGKARCAELSVQAVLFANAADAVGALELTLAQQVNKQQREPRSNPAPHPSRDSVEYNL